METGRVKRYVTVNADYMADGTVCPHSIVLEDRTYLIERITKVDQAKNNGSMPGRRRFRIIVQGIETSLFLENERWYVGRKVSY